MTVKGDAPKLRHDSPAPPKAKRRPRTAPVRRPNQEPHPQDAAVRRMLWEKKRKDKIDHRNQMLREWKLGQAQNKHDTYTSLMVHPHELAPARIRAERDQVHRLLQHHGARRPNFIPN